MNIKGTGVDVVKVRVFRKGATGADEAELSALLEEAGCVEVGEDGMPLVSEDEDPEGTSDELDPAEVDGNEEEVDGDGESEEEDDITLIVVLTPECVDDPTLEEEVGRAVGGGGRAVGVWPRESEATVLPPILEKVGSGVVIWDPRALADVLADAGTVWDTPTGEPRPTPETKRNKC